MYRQGDILLTTLSEGVKGEFKLRPSGVIAQGEATGHAHRIEGGKVFATIPSDDWVEITLYILVEDAARLVHDEHNPIALPPGLYKVIRQVQWENNWCD
jgi:hypothetical protein